ncbi:MAG: DUF1320 domain-containing protein [Dysgonamonadaceae bacterium]|jgi:phage gp36-like protein|nr:DUF1320 domain-containing protein [Dysgonamonadaceae bacterium]
MEAAAEVSGYLCARYNIAEELLKSPSSGDRNTMVVKLVRDIAIYNCHSFSAPVNIPENRIKGYENAIKLLRDIQSEKASVPGLERLTTASDGSVSSNFIAFDSEPVRNHYM